MHRTHVGVGNGFGEISIVYRSYSRGVVAKLLNWSPCIVIALKSHRPGIGVNLIFAMEMGRSHYPKPVPLGYLAFVDVAGV